MSVSLDPPAPLGPDQISLIETSFTRALRGKAELADRVYNRFFALEPGVRRLFPADLSQQRAKITRALSFTVRAMSSDQELARIADGLARSHQKFHLRPGQLEHMAEAILGALQDTLDEDFDPATHRSWQAAFNRFLPMIKAAQDKLDAMG